jgi:hypothetical protein
LPVFSPRQRPDDHFALSKIDSEIVPASSPEPGELHRTSHHVALATHQLRVPIESCRYLASFETVNHTTFEGTSEIQQLAIARAISGMRIE